MKKLTTKDILEVMADIKSGLIKYSEVDFDLANGVAIGVSEMEGKYHLYLIDSDTGIPEDTIGTYDHVDEIGFQLAMMYM